jgi:hypothetical protein
MYRIAFAVIALAAVSASQARAEMLDPRDLYQRAEALVQSLIGGRAADPEMITPPGNIDPRMALLPPRPPGTLRLIAPPDRPTQR